MGGAIKHLATKAEHAYSSFKEYGDEAKRRATFIGSWPSRLNHERIALFARWGLFYTGHGDLVRCFQCGIGLRGWSEDHDPLKEHIRFSPKCQHLQDALPHRQIYRFTKILDVAKACFSSKSQADVPSDMAVCQIPTADDIQALVEENRKLRMQRICKVCLQRWKKILFMPCQHLWVCQQCGAERDICPCGERIENKIPVTFVPNF